MVTLLVRARMRRHAKRPIDIAFVRSQFGHPKSVRQLLFLLTGARNRRIDDESPRPAGEWVFGRGSSADSPVILYLHGGGFIACSPETHRSLVGSLTTRLTARAFVPEYRLAPEHPYPAALDDAFAAYCYLLQRPDVNPNRIVIAGDSAGGGLAIALAMRVRDAGVTDPGVRAPAAVVAFSPWTDMAATGASIEENSERCAMFAAVTIRRASLFYLGDNDAQDPGASPVYGTYENLPPMLIHASSDEVLRDDSVRVAERAIAAGVTVQFRLWSGVPHCWQFFPAVLPEASESLALTVQFVREQLALRSV